jgi:hypothetical protein
MSDPTLKPCPLCGGPAEYTEHEKTCSARAWCASCGTEGPLGGLSDRPGAPDTAARDGWNTRSIEDALRARAEAAERDAETWRGFAGSAAIAVYGASTGGVIANHLAVDDLPDLLGAVKRLRARAEAALATALATARAEAAERARILDVIRERAASRTAQAATCAEAGGNADVVGAKASECGALAAIIDGTATMPRWPGRPVESA